MVKNGAPTRMIHPIHAVLLAGSLPLFLGALLSDWAYSATYQIQWSNFASWLLAGALVLVGLALFWALIGFVRADARRDRRWLLFTAALGATFLLGFIDSLVHAKDAWASMPEALVLSVIVFLIALVANWLGFSMLGREGGR